ncbi:PREDICTED: protein disulfide-isomerase A6-like [Acropora digitifera]|uniref:protein disulfide-isomerase A6-like n=1 Tax=Acropora digitifera TaxID=70779 RepID=UPI00077AFE34|nr:PREDICTED: protein disulfide-isomerase A6-like [Acropora digitifera]
MRLIYGILCSCMVALCRALYGSHTDVVELTANNFNSLVMDSDAVWLVEFYAPWCGHCKALAPEWTKAASALKGVIKVGAVDMDNQMNQQLGGQYGIRGFPTIKVFGSNKNSPNDYNGARTAQAIVDSGLSALKSMVKDKLSGGGRRSGSSGGKRQDGGKAGDEKDVIELTDSNFEKEVLNTKDLVLVEFFAPWCGHCQRLAPEWAKVATELKGKVKVGALDATVHTVTAGRYEIRGYPTIKVFSAGAKDSHSIEDYQGPRSASDIIQFALDKLADSIEPPEVLQIVNSQVVKENCEEKPICIVAVLPHILDSGASGRNQYLEIMKSMAEKYKKKMWGWIWSEAGSQSKLEDALGLGGFGYPAMAAVNARKMKYATLKGPFDSAGVDEFLRTVSVGRGSTSPVKGAALPSVEETAPWDGKDGELPVDEDIDLSDVDLDEDEGPTKEEL